MQSRPANQGQLSLALYVLTKPSFSVTAGVIFFVSKYSSSNCSIKSCGAVEGSRDSTLVLGQL